MMYTLTPGPIGVFDSGYGGLTVLKAIRERLPEYDYLYLGDNARTPYGTRSFEAVYQFTLEGVKYLFEQGCPLVVLACNTASAKALRTIQQRDLPLFAPDRRVLGVIRPTAEVIGNYSKTRHIGLFATSGTVKSDSYAIEIRKFSPDVNLTQEACPMWVPLVENGELSGAGSEFFVKKHIEILLSKDPDIDTILLACTHYPLLKETITKFLPMGVALVEQGGIVAESLADYLVRHPEMERNITRKRQNRFMTTDDPKTFNEKGNMFLGQSLDAIKVTIL